MISCICNCNLSHLCKICRSFMPYLNPFTYARTMSPEDTFGIISYSNIVRHDQWPAFLYNLITISSHLNFLLTDRTLRQGSLSTSLLRQGSLSQYNSRYQLALVKLIQHHHHIKSTQLQYIHSIYCSHSEIVLLTSSNIEVSTIYILAHT